ncbi:hypothetical protein BH11ARM2_BH11ARM2_10050 [soil metagenome]
MTREDRNIIALAWRKVGEDALEAAYGLFKNGHYRSCASRSYYAAYAFLAEALVTKPSVSFQEDREGPEHKPLPELIEAHLKRELSRGSRRQIRADIRTLYSHRLNADYQPRRSVRKEIALEALQKATIIAENVRRIRG